MIRVLWVMVKVLATLAALGAVVGLSFLLTLRFAVSTESVEVPKLVGLDPPSAARVLDQLGLGIKFEEEERNTFDDAIPPGSILLQEPAPGGLLKKGRKVKVVLSLGPRHLYVPRVVGEPVTVAQVRIQQAGLKIGDVVYSQSDLVPENVVVDQEPTTLDESPDAGVNLLVSAGRRPPTVVMPDLIGQAALRVQSFLEVRGYRVKVEFEVYQGAPEGRVIRQKPLAGYPIRVGDAIWLWVSRPLSQVP